MNGGRLEHNILREAPKKATLVSIALERRESLADIVKDLIRASFSINLKRKSHLNLFKFT